jgi:hypothetical protein
VVTGLLKKTQDLLKKLEQEHEIYVEASDKVSYWVVSARIPKKEGSLHKARKYISAHNEEGNILVFSEPEITENYSIENWGKMETFDDFVHKAIARILADKEESATGLQEGCGTGCG